MIEQYLKHDMQDLLKCHEVKDYIKKNRFLLERYSISLPIKNENDFFYFESLVFTLKNKEKLEGVFVSTYDDMIDYWQTLTYNERKRLMNIEIDRALQEMEYVESNGKINYVPCFNDRINEIYKNEMVLFELKQYHRLRFDCKDMIDKNCIDLNMVKSGILSLDYIMGEFLDYWAFCSINKVLYHFKNDKIIQMIPLVNFEENLSELTSLIEKINESEEIGLMFLIEKHWISEKAIKKVTKKMRLK